MTKIGYLDCETTGLDEKAQIIQIGVIDENGNALLDTLVQCQGEIPQPAIDVHGITKEDLKDAPTWPEVHQRLCEILNSAEKVYIYNSEYDTRLIRQTAARYDLEVPDYESVCLMKMFANVYNDGRWSKLIYACADMDFETNDLTAHSAVGDCEMTRRLHLAMIEDRERLKKERQQREKTRQSRERAKAKKLAYVPDDIDSYPHFATKRPEGSKTLSQIALRDIDKYEFAGTCCDTYGNRGFVFIPKSPVEK